MRGRWFEGRSRWMHQRLLVFILWMLCGGLIPVFVVSSLPRLAVAQPSPAAVVRLEEQGRLLYEAQQFADAIAVWQQAAQAYARRGVHLKQAQLLSYVSSAYQALSQWAPASTALHHSRAALNRSPVTPQVLAQVLNTEGSLQLAMGETQAALSTWQQAAVVYQDADDAAGLLRSQINQAQALRTLGFHRQALTLLQQVQDAQARQPASVAKATALRSLGVTFQQLGRLDAAEQALQESIAIATQLHTAPNLVAAAQLEWANTLQLSSQPEAALVAYRAVQAQATDSMLKVQGQLNELNLLLDMQQWSAAEERLPRLQAQLAALPSSTAKLEAHLNFVDRLTRTQADHPLQGMTWSAIATLAADGVQQAQVLEHPRLHAYALGFLGRVYEQTQQWHHAQTLTEQALTLAQANQAPDMVYQWQWQLGRLLAAQADSEIEREQAIAAYTDAVDTLQSIRTELATYNSDLRFSFQDSVEPVYRELVSLLLSPSPSGSISQPHLEQARQVMEALYLVELDNFFQEACLDTHPVAADQIDAQAAVFYPIVLRDRIDVIVRLPNQPLRHFSTPIAQADLRATAQDLRHTLVIRSGREYRRPSQQLYNWLIRPIVPELERSHIKTLVFALDSPLRNVPMATLNDGHQYLIEQYSIALTPGLQLLPSQPLRHQKIQVLASGLTQARQGFAPLSHVAGELKSIQASLPSQILMDQDFTQERLQQQATTTAYPIVHIATHGQFSSAQANTFLLAWNNRIGVNQLRTILQQHPDHQRTQAIELLVLSACNTATGDQRATLGLAGLAVRSGARSTVATLWSVEDQTTSKLMGQLYQELAQQTATKAEALRNAQLSLLQDPSSQHPYYWAPYVLVGNWL